MSTVTFQDGSAYSGTIDTRLLQTAPSTGYGTATTIGIDTGSNAEEQVLLAFTNLFGSASWQIPYDAVITSATLTLRTTNGSTQGGTLHRMKVGWSESSTWSSLGNGVQIDDTEAFAEADLTTGAVSTGSRGFDVTKSLQAWKTAGTSSAAQNAANFGWVFRAGGTDGWDFYSSEGSVKPLLAVTYTTGTTPPPPSPPVVSIAAASSSPQPEGPNGKISFTISLDKAATEPVTVNYATQSGTATAGSDFIDITNGSVTFAPNETTKTVIVDLIDDTLVEDLETFTVRLGTATNAIVSSTNNTVTGTISDNDAPDPPPVPVVSIAAASSSPQPEGPNGKISFTISLDKAATEPVTVNYATQSGTATAGSDFIDITNGSVTFAPNETTKTVIVDLIDDTLVENTENFSVKLTSATNATLGTGTTATASISDNDTPPPAGPVVSISSASPDPQVEGSSAKIKFTLTLSTATTQDVKVNYSTVDGTAKAGSDYTALLNKNVTFLAGETTKTITVSLLNDTVLENPEAFSIKINSATSASVSTTSHTATATIVDNDLPATVVKIIDTTQYKAGDPSGYGSGDPSGVAYIPGKNGGPGTLFIADSEHDESPYYSSTNLLGLNDDSSFRWHSLTSFSKEPTGLGYNPKNGYLYISDDDKGKIFWVDPANPSVKLGEIITSTLGLSDTEDPTFDPNTGNMYVVDGTTLKLYKFSATGQLLSSVALPSAMRDAEALTYSNTTSDGRAVFFVASGISPTIYQIDDTGRLLGATDILAGHINPITGVKAAPKGLELAPSSDLNDGNKMNLYVADYGADQKNDGRLFEIDLSTGWFVA
ncbi:hypothetical protein DC522_32550 [Microvirga sp. KLBC 81]|uniref:Calx-beta domain-containing protein n=1 Tax=Microvirga sp. KLBC 81 TaxID=1862707 RepID=UPI000D51A68B|nr:Calx-beta domain-containing protein [Microvirga sp. KLBC 81]PVE20407.1 hypothetical protein DC522_32550 [Microvirga sp. KLBC 81]